MTKLTVEEISLETQTTMLDRRVTETKNDLKNNVSMLDQRITQTETNLTVTQQTTTNI